MMKISLLLLLPILLIFAGCATRYDVRIDGLSATGYREAGANQAYELVSLTPGVESTDLFFKEVARYLEPVLADNGYRRANEGVEPDLVIAVNAHLSDPMVETRSYSEPMYVNSYGYDTVIRVPVVNKQGKVVRYAYSRYYSGPRTHFAGYVEHDRQFTVYDKILVLSAREASGEKAEELWALKVKLRSSSTDYRSALPYMLVAARPYIGKRTDGEEIIVIRDDSPEVTALKASLPNE